MMRRAIATVLALCLLASVTEAVVAQVQAARWHAPANPAADVVIGPDGAMSDTEAGDRGGDDRRLHHHSDNHGHDPGADHCAHAHTVGPTPVVSCEPAAGLTVDLRARLSDSAPVDRRRTPSPEPPRG